MLVFTQEYSSDVNVVDVFMLRTKTKVKQQRHVSEFHSSVKYARSFFAESANSSQILEKASSTFYSSHSIMATDTAHF